MWHIKVGVSARIGEIDAPQVQQMEQNEDNYLISATFLIYLREAHWLARIQQIWRYFQ